MNKELALDIIKLLSALEAIVIIERKMTDYLIDDIETKIETLRKIVLED